MLLEEHFYWKKRKKKKEKKQKKSRELNSITVIFHKSTCFIIDFIRNLNDRSMKINSGLDCVGSVGSSFQFIHET